MKKQIRKSQINATFNRTAKYADRFARNGLKLERIQTEMTDWMQQRYAVFNRSDAANISLMTLVIIWLVAVFLETTTTGLVLSMTYFKNIIGNGEWDYIISLMCVSLLAGLGLAAAHCFHHINPRKGTVNPSVLRLNWGYLFGFITVSSFYLCALTFLRNLAYTESGEKSTEIPNLIIGIGLIELLLSLFAYKGLSVWWMYFNRLVFRIKSNFLINRISRNQRKTIRFFRYYENLVSIHNLNNSEMATLPIMITDNMRKALISYRKF